MNVVILYESMRHVGKAMATYHYLMRELADDLAPDFYLWRMDVAVEPRCAVEAERDLSAAGVIIVATDGRQPCPPVFQRWRAFRNGKASLPSCAVIALVEASQGPAPATGSWNSILRVAATQIHPEIFVWNPLLPSDDGAWAAAALAPDCPAGDLRSWSQLPTPRLQP